MSVTFPLRMCMHVSMEITILGNLLVNSKGCPRKQSSDHRSTLSWVGRHSNLLSRASMSTAVARSFPRSKTTEENRVGGRKASKPVLSHTAKKQVSGSGEELSF